MNKQELQAELESLNIEYAEDNTKAELEALLEKAQSDTLSGTDASPDEASVEDSEEIPEGAVFMKQNVKCGGVTYKKGVQYNDMDEETLAMFKKRGFVYQSKMV